VHVVHQAADQSLLVVGVLMDEGAADPTIDLLLADDPGHEAEARCSDRVHLRDIVPVGDSFYHYEGSLTTPSCGEGVQWFVASEHQSASAEQAEHWQDLFGGTTNRPIQPLNGRTVYLLEASQR
jgi:carbonic anhydrase